MWRNLNRCLALFVVVIIQGSSSISTAASCKIDEQKCTIDGLQINDPLSKFQGVVDACTRALWAKECTYRHRELLLLARGLTRFRLKQFELARNDMEEAARIASNPEAASHILNSLAELHAFQREFDQALIIINKAIESAPRKFGHFMTRADIYRETSKFDLALQDYGRVATSSSEYRARAYFWRGRIFIVQEKYLSAVRDLTSAITENPTHAAALISRGDAYEKLGIMEAAIRDWQQGLALEPNLLELKEKLRTLDKP